MELRVILANFQGMKTIATDIDRFIGFVSQFCGAQEPCIFNGLSEKINEL